VGADPVEQASSGRSAFSKTAILAVIGLIVVVSAGAAGYFFVRSDSGKRSEANTVTEKVNVRAAALAQYFAPVRNQLGEMAQDPALISLFAAGDANTLEQESQVRLAQFQSGLKLRLLLPGRYEVDNSTRPPLGFASLELLRRAEITRETIPPEALLLGTDQAHIVFIERVKDASGTLIGLIHLSLSVDQLTQALASIADPSAYMELQQTTGATTHILASLGNADLKQGGPLQAGVPGSGWVLAYWAGAAPAAVEAIRSGSSAAVIIGLVLLLAGAVAAVFLRLRTGRDAGYDAPVVMAGSGMVYAGAIRAIMEGAHPGMEKLIPNLNSIRPVAGKIQPVPQDIETGDDITAMARAGASGASVAADDFFDLTGGGAAAGEPITEPKAVKAATPATGVPPAVISPTIFRTYDIRGIVGKELTPESVQKIGHAIGSEAAARNEKKIACGRDGRISSPELANALIAGLRAAGRDVVDIGMVPTPVLYYATHATESASGVMLTGSHNGPEYNGLKIVIGGETLSQDAIQDLHRRIEENDLVHGQGSLDTREIITDYIRRIAEDIPVALGGAFKMVVDCGNGVAGILAPQLYRALGHDVIELYCEVDGKFPNHHPDPSQPENLQDLIAKVKAEKADLGYAFDGDADRLGVVDGRGNIIWPDRQLMVLARDVLSRNPGAPIIYDVKCSRHLKSIITASGGRPLMWKTGHSLIKGKMKEVNAPLAGEMSGHIFFKERWYGFDDALYTGARLLEVLMAARAKPADVFAKIPEGVSTPELRVDLPESEHRSFMDELKGRMVFAGAEVYDVDGFRIEFTDGWGLVRPSNTSPCLVLRFEADNQAALSRIKSQFHDLLLSVNPGLILPF
jgi:phosphomannomutase/phosphoglucomutase